MNTKFLITGLSLLIVACFLMVFMKPSGAYSEGFVNEFISNAAGTSAPGIGPFDGLRLSEEWRTTAPNEPLTGPEFQVGPDNLFIFKNNQCKPECCPASFSCDGGCVCTTPQQRNYINQRGGNRTRPDDGV